MKTSTSRSTIVSVLANKYNLAVMCAGIAVALGTAAEKPQPRLDRFGDPLPPGAIRRLGTLRFRQSNVHDLAFTSGGKQLIAGTRDGSLVVFDAASGRKLRRLSDKDCQYVRAFAFSPDGKRVACCCLKKTVVWELQTGRLIRQLNWPECSEAAFSLDGTKVAAIKESHGRRGKFEARVVVLEGAAESSPLKTVAEKTLKEGKPQTFGFNGIAFSPDSKFLAVRFSELYQQNPFVIGVASSQVWLLDAATGDRVRTFGLAGVPVACFAFQPGTGRLATYGKDGMIRFWDTATGKEVRHFQAAKGKEEDVFSTLRFSADGRRCAVLTDRARFLTVLDAKDGRVIRRIEGKESELFVALALSADGKTVATARPYDESSVRIWDVASGIERLAGAGHRAAATTLSLSADAQKLISRDDEGETISWNLQTGNAEVRPATGREQFGRLVWSRDFDQATLRDPHLRDPRWRVVYKNQQPAKMEIWSPDGGKLIRKIEMLHVGVPTVAFSPDGRHLAIAGRYAGGANSTVMLWEPEREEKPRPLPGRLDYCRELLFSHDGKRLIGTSGGIRGNNDTKGFLWVWDTEQARLLRNLAADGIPCYLLLTAEDRVLLAGIDGKDAAVRAWNIETGAELARMADPSQKPASQESNPRFQPAIAGLALSADSRLLAVVSSWEDASAVSIWETGSWKLVRAFVPTSPRNDVRSMLFSRAGRSLFVANGDTTILEWDVTGRFDRKTKIPNKDRLNLLWQTFLESPDKAYPAVWEMLDHPTESVPFLIEKVSPVKPVEEQRVRQLLAQLDSESFAEREEASRKLPALGELFEPMLRQALKERPSLEMKKRIEGVLESLNRLPTPEQLRLFRALAVLEWSGRSDAVEHLRRLAGGAPSARLTQAAKAAWQRR